MLIGDADAERVAVVMWVSDLTQPKFLQKINPKKTLEKRPADLSGRVFRGEGVLKVWKSPQNF